MKKESTMTPEQQARFDRIAAQSKAKAPAAAAAVSPPPAVPEAPAVVAEAAPTPKPRAPRKPRVVEAPPPVVEEVEAETVEEPTPAACGDSVVANILALQSELALKQGNVDIATAERDAVIAQIRELVA
jgi:hypothetical protein